MGRRGGEGGDQEEGGVEGEGGGGDGREGVVMGRRGW